MFCDMLYIYTRGYIRITIVQIVHACVKLFMNIKTKIFKKIKTKINISTINRYLQNILYTLIKIIFVRTKSRKKNGRKFKYLIKKTTMS